MPRASMPSVADPLSEADLRDLNKAQYLLNQLLQQLDKAEQAGRDVTDYRLRRDTLAEEVNKIKAAYFASKQ